MNKVTPIANTTWTIHMRSKTRRKAVSLLSLIAVVIGLPAAIAFVFSYFLGSADVYYSAFALMAISMGARLGAMRLARDYSCPGCGERVYGINSMIGPTRFPTACVKCGASLIMVADTQGGSRDPWATPARRTAGGTEVLAGSVWRSDAHVELPYEGSVQQEQVQRTKKSYKPMIWIWSVILLLLVLYLTGIHWMYLAPVALVAAVLMFRTVWWLSSVRCPKCELPVARAATDFKQMDGAPPPSCPRCGNAWDIEPATKASIDR